MGRAGEEAFMKYNCMINRLPLVTNNQTNNDFPHQ